MEITQSELDAAKAQRWYESNRFEEYIDFSRLGPLPDLPFTRITFNTEKHSAYATRGNPLATEDNEEEVAIDGCVHLTWEQAATIVGMIVTG